MFVTLKPKIKNKSNGTRHKKQITKNILSKYNGFNKKNRVIIRQDSGRNNTGRITVRHKGAAIKKKIYFLQPNVKQSTSISVCISLDTKKTCFISTNFNLESKQFWNSTASRNSCSGSIIKHTKNLTGYFSSFSGFLANFPAGINIFNVSSAFNKLCYAKSAGTFCTLLQKQPKNFLVRLPSGAIVELPLNTSGAIGKTSNRLHHRLCAGKAGISRKKGIRPSVRGIAMNPVDHPHGGRTNGGVHPKTPWGVPTRGKPTVKKKYVTI